MTAEDLDTVARRLVQMVEAECWPYGREDSVKLRHGRWLPGRTMLGVDARLATLDHVMRLASSWQMPSELAPLLARHHVQANVVLFGVEPGVPHPRFKVYLEFWERVRRHVAATGSREPQLLDLGLKWQPSDAHEHAQAHVARYWCRPLLSVPECMDRLRLVYQGSETAAQDLAIVRAPIEQAAMRRPGGAFIYMDVEEEGTPRHSFDINLYKAGLRLHELQAWLQEVRRHFQLQQADVDAWLDQCGACALGHLSGGLDRHGQPFLTIYYERWPMPLFKPDQA